MGQRWRGAQGINGIAVRQALIGVTVGMISSLLLKGYLSPPIAAAYASVISTAGVQEATERLGDGLYRVTMTCSMKHHRISRFVRAADAHGAHVALDWLMPACRLSGLRQATTGDAGGSWYSGDYTCEGSSYKQSRTVSAIDLRQAKLRAGLFGTSCRVDIVDQIACPALNPLCAHQSEDFRTEADLERVHLLR